MPVGDDNTYCCEQTPGAVKVFFDGHVSLSLSLFFFFKKKEGTLA